MTTPGVGRAYVLVCGAVAADEKAQGPFIQRAMRVRDAVHIPPHAPLSRRILQMRSAGFTDA